MPKVSKETLEKIRKALPQNAIQMIAEKTGLKANTVRQILFKPERFNKSVIEEAIKLGESNAAEVEEMINRANAL